MILSLLRSIIVFCLYHCMLYMLYCLLGMFTRLDYSSALEYSIIRRYTNIVYLGVSYSSHSVVGKRVGLGNFERAG